MPYLKEIGGGGERRLEDWERIGLFIVDVDFLFGQVLRADWLLLDQRLRGPIADAYATMRGRVLGPPEYDIVPGLDFWPRTLGPSDQEALAREGLAGAELDAKLAGYVSARGALAAAGGLKNLKRAWRWLRAILQSLGGAFPPGGVILEIADLLENGMRDVEELRRA